MIIFAKRKVHDKYKKPVYVDDIYFESREQAARYLKVAVSSISYAVKNGNLLNGKKVVKAEKKSCNNLSKNLIFF